jgi:uncharacterized membrane protein
MMSELVVVGFDGKFKAEEALLSLLKLEQEHLLALDDAVIVVKNSKGKIRVKAYHDLTEPVSEFGNELWGGIISAVVFHRELEIAQGVFDPNFLDKVEASLKPNSSAIFVVIRSAESDAVRTALSGIGGDVLYTTISEVERQKLQNALSAVA